MFDTREKNKGIILLEFVVALGLFTLFVTILTQLFATSISTVAQACHRTQALEIAMQVLTENINTSGQKQLDGIKEGKHWQLQSIESESGFTKQRQEDRIYQVRVSWQSYKDVTHSLQLVGMG